MNNVIKERREIFRHLVLNMEQTEAKFRKYILINIKSVHRLNSRRVNQIA